MSNAERGEECVWRVGRGSQEGAGHRVSHTPHWRRSETIDARGETETVERATTKGRVRTTVFIGENKAVSSESSVARSCAAQRRVFPFVGHAVSADLRETL